MTWKHIEEPSRDDGTLPHASHADIEPQLVGPGSNANGANFKTDCGWDNFYKNQNRCDTPDIVVVPLPIIIKDGEVKIPKIEKLPYKEKDFGDKDFEKKPYIDCGWGRLIDRIRDEKHGKVMREFNGEKVGGKIGDLE